MSVLTALQILAACALSLAGLAALWRAWARGRRPGPLVLLALGLWGLSTALWVRAFGAEIGTALAIETGSLLAFAFMLSRIERPSKRAPGLRAQRVAPEAGAANLAAGPRGSRWTTAARVAVAGPLALAAALALGLIVGLRAPLHEQTRLILGGLAVPTLWAAMVVACMALRRVWPTALVLALIVATAGAIAWAGR